LIEAGIARAVIALEDPDPRVMGKGVAAMRTAGIDIATGVLAAEAASLNQGYLGHAGGGRPMLTLKAATTLDGRIATGAGESKWITGETARRWAHAMRARHDAVMVGIGTVLADDPELTCRLPGLPARPTVRVVLDSTLRLPLDGRLARGAGAAPVWVVACEGAPEARRTALAERGVEVIEIVPGEDGRPDPAAALTALGARGLTRILAEGGGTLAASLLAADLVDRLAWFRAARLIGGDGVPMPAAFGVRRLADAPSFVREEYLRAGDDVLETYRRAP
jgi:diaminohydroxyphosphoribosylaminopyrimidine deaminase/5-amino-6-(5-phosphoribosylamino)uracil reductase